MKKLLILLTLLTMSRSENTRYCDIKGNVVRPGVYEIKDDYKIKDIVELAGGLKDNSYTDNINLSKKVEDEMVIYINTKKEIDYIKSLNNCDCSPKYVYIECQTDKNEAIEEVKKLETKNDRKELNMYGIEEKEETNVIENSVDSDLFNEPTTKSVDEIIKGNLININTCTIEDLKTINGLGTKKVEKIIEYRNTNGYFEKIEDIMKVSGIGDATFNSIKEYIKV